MLLIQIESRQELWQTDIARIFTERNSEALHINTSKRNEFAISGESTSSICGNQKGRSLLTDASKAQKAQCHMAQKCRDNSSPHETRDRLLVTLETVSQKWF